MESFSGTLWWSQWQACNQVLCQFDDILPFFLQNHIEYSPSTTKQLTQLITDTQKSACLQLELAVVIDVGKIFLKPTYALEGYEALVFKCYEVLCELYAFIQMAHFPNLVAVSRRLCHTTTQNKLTKPLITYGKSCVEPGQKFDSDLKNSVKDFEKI